VRDGLHLKTYRRRSKAASVGGLFVQVRIIKGQLEPVTRFGNTDDHAQKSLPSSDAAEDPSVSKPQQVVDLALSPAVILGRERIDAGIYADVANEQLRALDHVRDVVHRSLTETACVRHRPLHKAGI
jgi:hypothetical protein